MTKVRKLISALVALALCLAVCGACAETYTVEGLYSVEYDDSMTLDATSYALDNTDTYTWLFMLHNDDVVIDASMSKMTSPYESLSLFSASEEEKEAYMNDTLDMFSDYNYKFVATVMGGEADALIPFYLYSGSNEDGEYLMGETIASGYSLGFSCYYTDESKPVDDELEYVMVEFLSSFMPARRSAE